MKKITKILSISFLVVMLLTLVLSFTCFAAGDTNVIAQAQEQTKGFKAIGAGIALGLAAAGGAIGMGSAIAKSSEGISRQPEAEGKIRTTLMLGLVFIETAIIYALIVAILIIFVL